MNEDKKKKLAELKTGSQHLTEKYGKKGTPSREEFEAKAKAWYFDYSHGAPGYGC